MALGSLGRRADAALPALDTALSDTAVIVRAEAAWALGRIARGAQRPLSVGLTERLWDASPLVAARALQAVASFRVPVVILSRIDSLIADSASASRKIGQALLTHLNDPAIAVKRFDTLLDGRDAELRAMAASSLGNLGADAVSSLPHLERALQDSDGDVRESATDAITLIRQRDVASHATPLSSMPASSGADAITVDPMHCDHRPVERSVPTNFIVLPGSSSLSDDGRGAYRQERGALSVQNYAFSLRLPYALGSDVAARRAAVEQGVAEPSRSLVVDLRSPVRASGARPLGVVRDSAAMFATFYMLGADRVIRNTRDIPIGATILSDRTEMVFFIDGALHHLTFGPWGLGQCGEGYAEGGVIRGEGTTRVRITRRSEREYIVEAPAGSVGRLWDIRRMESPMDRGLYQFSFRVQLEQTP